MSTWSSSSTLLKNGNAAENSHTRIAAAAQSVMNILRSTCFIVSSFQSRKVLPHAHLAGHIREPFICLFRTMRRGRVRQLLLVSKTDFFRFMPDHLPWLDWNILLRNGRSELHGRRKLSCYVSSCCKREIVAVTGIARLVAPFTTEVIIPLALKPAVPLPMPDSRCRPQLL